MRPPSKLWAVVAVADSTATPIEQRRFWTEGAAHNWRDRNVATTGWFEVRPAGDLRPCEEVWHAMFAEALAAMPPSGPPCAADPDGLHSIGCGCDAEEQPTLMSLCVCGQHFYCPDGYHAGSGCSCTPDCCLDPSMHEHQGDDDEPCALCDEPAAAHAESRV
jgi:hypothetical protein